MASGSIIRVPVNLETYPNGLQLLVRATSSALSDRGFDLAAARAQKARLCTEKLLDWTKLEAGSLMCLPKINNND